MAERKRRGEDAVDDRLDEAFDDDTAVDDDLADDELDDLDEDDLDEEDLDEDDERDEDDAERVGAATRGRGGRAGTSLTKSGDRDRADGRPGTRGRGARPGDKRPTRSKSDDRPNIFARFANFIREVVAELRKVIWPTRKELLTYTVVVVVFVVFMLSVVGGLDWLFTEAVLWVFGNGETAE